MVQTTLFGGVAGQQLSSNANKPRSDMQRTTSTQRNIFGQQPRKTKQWDQTAFAKSGVRPPKSKDKGKGGPDEDEDEPVEFEQFPAPFVSRTSYSHVCESHLDSFLILSWVCVFPTVLKVYNVLL
jgi:ATP-dependent DNA helicase MPH1